MANLVIWGIHAGKYGEADSLFDSGQMALGWDTIGDLSQILPTREAFKAVVRESDPGVKEGAIPVNAGQLYRFIHEAKLGDLVVWRPKNDRTRIRIGEIAGEYQYDPQRSQPYPHQRPVHWKAVFDATRLTQGALFELGSSMSFFGIRNHASEWAVLLGRAPSESDTPPAETIDQTVGPIAEQIEESTRDFILKRLSTELKGHPLAAFVAHVLNAMGYRTRVSPPGADGGIDILAHKDELGFEPPIIKVQVKSGSGKVGQPEVSSLLGTLSQGEHGLLVALGGFTPQAAGLTRTKSNLRLIDGEELVELVLAHYEAFDSRYKGLLPLKRVYVPDPDLEDV
jgi:restriction system protein